jgi:cell wall-associated NlpC family hydrolase
MSGAALAEAALALVGTRFRLHGRDPQHGLDCIGLLGAALERIGRPVALPPRYTMRNRDLAGLLPAPETLGFAAASASFQPGDTILTQPGPGQFHLAIASPEGGWVHAHIGLRRVVHQPGPPPGPVVHHWRLLESA